MLSIGGHRAKSSKCKTFGFLVISVLIFIINDLQYSFHRFGNSKNNFGTYSIKSEFKFVDEIIEQIVLIFFVI